MKSFTLDELTHFFKAHEQAYNVQVPIKLHDGTRSLGNLADGELALVGGALPMKPTGVFAPYLDMVLAFAGEKINLPQREKPIFLVGLTAEDAACLEFVDRFFKQNYYDELYFSKRERSVTVVVSGKCGSNGEFLKIVRAGCDLELIYTGNYYIAVGLTELGKQLITATNLGNAVDMTELKQLQQQSDELPQDDYALVQAASKLILANKIPDTFWQNIAQRCIACTGCTVVCPTCTCFDCFDRKVNTDQIQRWRLRDSCQLDGFMREASGHNPMGKEFIRTRRRIHHKLAADVIRYGHITCFLCGRCDKVCPSNIGIKSVCRELIQKFAN